MNTRTLTKAEKCFFVNIVPAFCNSNPLQIYNFGLIELDLEIDELDDLRGNNSPQNLLLLKIILKWKEKQSSSATPIEILCNWHERGYFDKIRAADLLCYFAHDLSEKNALASLKVPTDTGNIQEFLCCLQRYIKDEGKFNTLMLGVPEEGKNFARIYFQQDPCYLLWHWARRVAMSLGKDWVWMDDLLPSFQTWLDKGYIYKFEITRVPPIMIEVFAKLHTTEKFVARKH